MLSMPPRPSAKEAGPNPAQQGAARSRVPRRGDTLPWHDGGNFPPGNLSRLQSVHREAGSRGRLNEDSHDPGFAANGSLRVGDKGIIYLDDASGDRYRAFPHRRFARFSSPRGKVIAALTGPYAGLDRGDQDRKAGLLEFRVCHGTDRDGAAGQLWQFARASRSPGTPARCGLPNVPEAEALIKPPYRKGWDALTSLFQVSNRKHGLSQHLSGRRARFEGQQRPAGWTDRPA